MNIRNRPNTYLHPLLISLWHTVIPGLDPESRKHTFVNNLVAYTGFRVPARNDGMLTTSFKGVKALGKCGYS